MAIHATYQFEDAVDCAFGKRERMREWGIWTGDASDGASKGSIDDDGENADCGGLGSIMAPRLQRRPRPLHSSVAAAAIKAAEGEKFLVLTDDDMSLPKVVPHTALIRTPICLFPLAHM